MIKFGYAASGLLALSSCQTPRETPRVEFSKPEHIEALVLSEALVWRKHSSDKEIDKDAYFMQVRPYGDPSVYSILVETAPNSYVGAAVDLDSVIDVGDKIKIKTESFNDNLGKGNILKLNHKDITPPQRSWINSFYYRSNFR